MKKNRIKVGIIQLDVQLGQVSTNLKRAKLRLSRMADNGAQLILLPEMWSSGFANKQIKKLSETTPEVLSELASLAKAHQVAIIGSLPEKAGGDIYNTAYVVDKDGTLSDGYRKIHLFSPTGENKVYRGGSKAVVCETSLGAIGLMVCYDLRFPELCRALCLKGAHIVALVAQWPAARISHWKNLLVTRAIENQLFVLGANRCGKDPGLEYGGHSRIVSPWGELLAAAGKGPAHITAELDLELIKKTRDQIPCLRERVPEAYA